MTGKIDFEVAYSEHEFVRGMMHARSRSEFSWFNVLLSAISVAVGFGLVYWFWIRESGAVRNSDVIVGLVALAVSFPIGVAIDRMKPSVETTVARIYRDSPIYRETFSVRIDEDGIESRSPSFQSLVHWDAFSTAFESDDDFYFLLSESQPMYFPKRAMSPEQISAIRKIASQHMGSKARFSY